MKDGSKHATIKMVAGSLGVCQLIEREALDSSCSRAGQ